MHVVIGVWRQHPSAQPDTTMQYHYASPSLRAMPSAPHQAAFLLLQDAVDADRDARLALAGQHVEQLQEALNKSRASGGKIKQKYLGVKVKLATKDEEIAALRAELATRPARPVGAPLASNSCASAVAPSCRRALISSQASSRSPLLQCLARCCTIIACYIVTISRSHDLAIAMIRLRLQMQTNAQMTVAARSCPL